MRDGLNEGFGFKCAYCESFFGATQPVAIEHYRPKARVSTEKGNQPRLLLARRPLAEPAAVLHRLQQPAPAGDCGRRRLTVGKGDQFPISSELRRAAKEGDEKQEARLLVHPCLDDPAKHLVFEPDGIVSWKTRKGRESIRVYALLRRGLVQARKAFQVEVLTHIAIARGLALELETSGPNPRLEALLLQELQALARFVDPEHEYSATARALIDPVLEELTS